MRKIKKKNDIFTWYFRHIFFTKHVYLTIIHKYGDKVWFKKCAGWLK